MEREGPGFVFDILNGADLYAPVQSDPRWREFLRRYGADEEEDLSHIRFNPKLPAEVEAALAAAE